jgi:hypothetical protein
MTYNATTGVAELIPDLIVPEILASSAREEIFMPHVRRFDFTGPGEVFSVPQSAVLDFAALGSATYIDGTNPDQTQWNPTSRSFTPAFRFLDVTIGIDSLQGAQPGLSMQDAIIKEAGVGLAKDHDSLFAALYTEADDASPDHEIGTDGTPLNFSILRSGYELLLTQNAPRPYVWVVYPTQVAELLQDNTFIDASVKGSPVLTSGIGAGGYFTQILDIAIYCSDQIDESSGRHSMMFCKNACFGYGFKRITNPVTGATSELMVDPDWDSGRRMVDINMTYQAAVGGLVKTSTSNNYVVDIIS